MATAIDKLKGELSKLTPEELQQRFTREELAEIDYTLKDARCAEDPLWWAQNFTATENPKWEQEGLPFVAPFPRKSYFVPVFEEFKRSKRLFIPKSREMLLSWCAAVWATSRAQWHKGEVVLVAEKEDKAKRLLSYCEILYRNQADWLKRRHPLKRPATALAIEWADGGKIFGLPGGADQIRIFHPSLVVLDEAAFMPEAEATYNACLPVAAQIIAISSAGPSWFGDMCTM